jgi:hypothetical protein
MGRNVVDFMQAPSVEQVAAANVDPIPYTGPARPPIYWFDAMRAAVHVPPCMIFENISTWSQGGYAAGSQTCPTHEGRAREVGHTGSMMVVVSDGSKWDPNYGRENIIECGRGWSDRATMPFFPYGNVFCCEAFLEGARAGRGAHLVMAGVGGGPDAMIPETWGFGSIASQLVSPSPIPNTDLDIVHIDDLTGGHPQAGPGAPDLYQEEVPLGAPRTIFVNGVADTFFVADDKLWWIHENPQTPKPHAAVVVSPDADSANPEIDIVPTGFGPVITLRKKSPADAPECLRVTIKGWAYVAEPI